MSVLTIERSKKNQTTSSVPIYYPESDGQPMADNTKQFRYIVTIKEGLEHFLREEPVFVAGDLLWYPVEGDNKTRVAPDVLVAFDRPKGDRGSYLQWREEGIAPQVVFEILSPGNRLSAMREKFKFYNRYGVEEYYIYDPDRGRLEGWHRVDGELQSIEVMNGWESPRLGVRFALVDGELILYQPDGEPLLNYQQVAEKAIAEAIARQEAEDKLLEAAEKAASEAIARQEAEDKLLNTARNLLPILDDVAISEATGLELSLIRELRSAGS